MFSKLDLGLNRNIKRTQKILWLKKRNLKIWVRVNLIRSVSSDWDRDFVEQLLYKFGGQNFWVNLFGARRRFGWKRSVGKKSPGCAWNMPFFATQGNFKVGFEKASADFLSNLGMIKTYLRFWFWEILCFMHAQISIRCFGWLSLDESSDSFWEGMMGFVYFYIIPDSLDIDLF